MDEERVPGPSGNDPRDGEWLTVAAAARKLSVSPRAIRGRIRRGTIEWKPVGNTGRLVRVLSRDRSPDGPEDGSEDDELAVLREQMADLRVALARAEERARSAEAVAVSDVEAARRIAEAEIGAKDSVIAELKAMLADARRPWWRRLWTLSATAVFTLTSMTTNALEIGKYACIITHAGGMSEREGLVSYGRINTTIDKFIMNVDIISESGRKYSCNVAQEHFDNLTHGHYKESLSDPIPTVAPTCISDTIITFSDNNYTLPFLLVGYKNYFFNPVDGSMISIKKEEHSNIEYVLMQSPAAFNHKEIYAYIYKITCEKF